MGATLSCHHSHKGLIKAEAGGAGQIGDALKALMAAGDPEALAAGKKAQENGGKLEITKEKSVELVKRAQEKGLIK